jgi:hypothetical protein
VGAKLFGSATTTAGTIGTSVVAGARVLATTTVVEFFGATPLLSNVVVVFVFGIAAFFWNKVVGEPDESELEPPHDATATRAIAKMAHLVTRDLI